MYVLKSYGLVCYRRPCAECGVYEQGLPPVVCPGCPPPGGALGYFLSDQNKDKTQRKSFTSSASHLTRPLDFWGQVFAPISAGEEGFARATLLLYLSVAKFPILFYARPQC